MTGGGNVTLHHGDWRTIFKDFEAPPSGFVIIADPPYSPRTHAGRRTGAETRKSSIHYRAITQGGCNRFVKFWAKHGPQFWVIFGDDVTAPWWRDALAKHGQYTFATVPWVKPDAAPRQVGDGPASAAEHISVASGDAPDPTVEFITIARWPHWPKEMFSRPGYYDDPTASTRGKNGDKGFAGAKPMPLMRKIVMHYSAPGQLVVDPFMGTGTTMLAAYELGRDALGCDVDLAACEIAKTRLGVAAQQTRMFTESPNVIKPKQVDQWRAWNADQKAKQSSVIAESTDTASRDD